MPPVPPQLLRNTACTYFGGSVPAAGVAKANDRAQGVHVVPGSENIVIVGNTGSNNFGHRFALGLPGWDQSHRGGSDAFLVKLSYDAVETTLGYATYFGRGNLTGDPQYADRGRHLTLKPSNSRVVFSGDTAVSDFPTASNGASNPVFGPTWTTGGTSDPCEA
ncbi:MAG: hypothetical protein L6Q99_15720 [Planctomycetes bacterium]|nr:hypothetical protein [Planctomycetota bacterium]